MSDATIYKPRLVYEEPFSPVGNGREGDDVQTQMLKALISIANSLAVLADETQDISPIIHAAFIIGGAPDDEPQSPQGQVS